MDTSNGLTLSTSHPWDMYLFTILLLIALYFVQKYMYLIDEKLAQIGKSKPMERRKPWPFLVALLSGLFVFLYNVFSPSDLSFEIGQWGIEWLIFGIIIFSAIGIFYESIRSFGLKSGLIRSTLYVVLAVPYFYAGMASGFILATLLVLVLLVFFLRYWKKFLTIN